MMKSPSTSLSQCQKRPIKVSKEAYIPALLHPARARAHHTRKHTSRALHRPDCGAAEEPRHQFEFRTEHHVQILCNGRIPGRDQKPPMTCKFYSYSIKQTMPVLSRIILISSRCQQIYLLLLLLLLEQRFSAVLPLNILLCPADAQQRLMVTAGRDRESKTRRKTCCELPVVRIRRF